MLSRTRSFLKKTRIEVTTDHEDVLFRVGNWEMRLPYDVALTLAQQLRVTGKAAKRNAGDNSRLLRVAGKVTNANPYPKKGRAQVSVKP